MKKLALSLAIVAFFAFGSAGMSNVVAATTSTEMAKPDDKKKDDKKRKKVIAPQKLRNQSAAVPKRKAIAATKIRNRKLLNYSNPNVLF